MSPLFNNKPSPSEREIPALITRLKGALTDREQYKRLLEQRGADAQKLLDLFQWLLDTPKQDVDFQGKLIVTSQKLSKKSGLFPSCYDLKGIKQDGQHPVQAGGFADIYKGDCHGQKVCLKVLRTYQNTKIEDFLKRISNEAILWGQLAHPNLLPFYGLYRFKTRICLVSPWMEAGEVSKYLKANPNVPRLPLALDVARGLLYLHKNGAVHGDIKGPNVLVDNVGRACLTDFGISSVPNSGIMALTSDSYPASVGGSVRWQAPELFAVESETDEAAHNTVKSDVYSWASLCYEVFAGELPFSSITNEYAIMFRIKDGGRPARPPDSSPPWLEWGLTESIWSLMELCWKADPAERPNMEGVIQELSKASKLSSVKDQRSKARRNVLSPGRFRKMVRKSPIDIMAASALDAILYPPDIDLDELTPGGENDEDDMGERSADASAYVSMSPGTHSDSSILGSSPSTPRTSKYSNSRAEFTCRVCDATFPKQQGLTRHMRIHSGGRIHKCRVCGELFPKSDLLFKHVTKQHREDPLTSSSEKKLVLKSACDPCVQSGLSCNGHYPCSTCIQRKCPCSFKISRQNSMSSTTSSTSLDQNKSPPTSGASDDFSISHPKPRPDHKRHFSWQSQPRRPPSIILSGDAPDIQPHRSKSEGSNVLAPGPSPLTRKRQSGVGNSSPRPSLRELEPEVEVEIPKAFKRTSLVDMPIPEEPQQEQRQRGLAKKANDRGLQPTTTTVIDGGVLTKSPDPGYKKWDGSANEGTSGGSIDATLGDKQVPPPRTRRSRPGNKRSLRSYIQG